MTRLRANWDIDPVLRRPRCRGPLNGFVGMVTSEVKTILVVAAENFELKYIRPQSGAEWILTANGPGPALAGEAADRVGPRVDAVISAGLCGALSAGLHVGDTVVASAVNGEPVERPATVGRL